MYTIPHQAHTELHEICVALIALVIGYFIIRLRFNYQWLLVTILLKKGFTLIGMIFFIVVLMLIFSHLTNHNPVATKAVNTINHPTK